MNPNTRLLTRLVGVVVVMGALSWAAVPFYSWFCQVTGFAGTPSVAERAPDQVLDETVRVRFDANVMPDMGWTFRPMQADMTLRIGETGLAYYEAVNISDEAITGTATYNVSPDAAGYFFDKIECFCFTEQTLQPGERIEMPVTFFVNPEIVDDRDAKTIRDITLSYTFYRQDQPEQRSASAPQVAATPARAVN
ncbi:cytochrome c oxidase assembly protein [uncultured Paracoccus sp.]|uniref:cytochrome c oxidase assembly protein n=1 Tax=uncultured Paracoccus sp. TaxID=189685 RepID=UPI0026140279|nr:cytochrome c oxidase assembly protein [uncultured Paracoccus sp.]